MIKGKATSEHTQNYQKTFLSLTYNKLGNTHLMVSQAGVGTYRMASMILRIKNHFLLL